MIDFRYHIVSIIAVFLALALGLFLGSTTLQSTVTNNLHQQANRVTGDNKALRAENKQLSGSLDAELGLSAALEPYAVSGQLAGQSVAVISAPGVDGPTHDKLVTTLAAAGATLTEDVTLQPAYLDPTQDTTLGDLAATIAGSARLPNGNGSAKASALLSRMLVARPARQAPSRLKVSTTLETLAQGKYLKYATGTQAARPADLAVLLVPAANPSSAATVARAQDAILTTLAGDLRSASVGTVVAGPSATSGSDDGALAAVRADAGLTSSLSTVNLDTSTSVGDPAAGRIAVVLALAQAPDHVFGAYGLNLSGRPPVPTPSPSP